MFMFLLGILLGPLIWMVVLGSIEMFVEYLKSKEPVMPWGHKKEK